MPRSVPAHVVWYSELAMAVLISSTLSYTYSSSDVIVVQHLLGSLKAFKINITNPSLALKV